jgi:hypothetical protein
VDSTLARATQPLPGLAGGEPLEPARVAQRLLGGGDGLLGLPDAAVFGDPGSTSPVHGCGSSWWPPRADSR